MLGFISQKMTAIYESIRTKRLSSQQIDQLIEEMESNLLEADLPYDVTKHFLSEVREDLVGQAYPKHLNAQQAFVKVLHQRFTELLGGSAVETQPKGSCYKILLEGLQGSGKTTSAIKLAAFYKKNKKNVAVVSLDFHRPAAREQLEILAKKVGIDIIAQTALSLDEAMTAIQRQGKFFDIVIIDTAGRTQLSQELMQELVSISQQLNPQEVLYVLDAMAGQESLNVARAFHSLPYPLTGAIATKLDSQARAGAIMGLKYSLGIPIKFLSQSEHVDLKNTLTVFHPDRIAQRILGMGDVLSLIEQIEANIDQEKARKLQEALLSKNEYTFEDMLAHFEQVGQMTAQGSTLGSLMQNIPGMSQMMQHIAPEQITAQFKKAQAIISSMTPKERRLPDLIEQPGRKARISAGAGVSIADLNALNKQRRQLAKMHQMMKNPAQLQKMMQQMGAGAFPKGFPE
jgi:signal recognition particle subunit SRP54